MTNRRRVSGLARAFAAYAGRPPSTWQRVLAAVVAVALPLGLWDKRGPAVGVVAFLVYGALFLAGAFAHGRLFAWSRRHVMLDGMVIVPLTFLALAYLTNLSLGWCVVLGVAAGLVLVPVAVRRRDGAG